MQHEPISFELLTGKVGIILCTRGSGTLVINGKSHRMTRGMIAVKSPILMFSLGEYDEDFELLSMMTKLEYMVSQAQKIFNSGYLIMVLQNPVIQMLPEDMALVLNRAAELEHIERLKELDAGSGQLSSLFEQSKVQLSISTFMMLMGKYYATYVNKVSHQNFTKDLQLASQFMLRLIAPDNVERRVNWYAEEAHLSVGHFSAMIRKILGQSPQHWIEIITINKAKDLLRKREKSIKEIAQELGFPEQFTFRKYFKEHAGVSPTEFRTPQG